MELVDHSLVDQLRDLGCNIDRNTKKIQDLSNKQIMEYALDCISHIDPNKYAELTKIDLGTQINMASKFRLASDLARACNSIGYKIKLEYQTFLYGNATEIRNLFLFLVERACREDATVLGPNQWLDIQANKTRDHSKIQKHKIGIKFETKWMPPSLNNITNTIRQNDLLFNAGHTLNRKLWQIRPIKFKILHEGRFEDRDTEIKIATTEGQSSRSRRPTVAPRRQAVTVDIKSTGVAHIISLCEWNQLNCVINYHQELSISTEENLANYNTNRHHEQNISTEENLANFNIDWNQELNISTKDDIVRQTGAKLLSEEGAAALESHNSNITSRETVQVKTDIQNIQNEIDKHQLKIQNNYHIIAKLNDKQAIFKEQEHGPSRSSYVKMLNEVIKQSRKQNDNLNKILQEIRTLQKEINTLSGRLQRSFVLVEEAIFKGAKSDEWNRKCYKLLAQMHEECDHLIQGVQDTGEVVRDIRQLEELVNLERSKGIDDSLSRVASDLKIVKDDNKMYQEKLLNNGLTKDSVRYYEPPK